MVSIALAIGAVSAASFGTGGILGLTAAVLSDKVSEHKKKVNQDKILYDSKFDMVKSGVQRHRCQKYDDEQFITMAVNAGGLEELLERVKREPSPVSKFLETDQEIKDDIFPDSYEVPVGRYKNHQGNQVENTESLVVENSNTEYDAV